MTSSRGELRDEVGRERGRVGERLVEGLGEGGQEQRRVRPEHELAVLRPVALGDEPRVGQLVEAALLEADRERAQRLRGSSAASAASTDESIPPERSTPTGTSRHEMRAHRVAQPRPQLLDELGLVVVAHLVRRDRRRPRVARDLDAAVLPGQQVPGLQLAHVAEDRQRPRNRVEGEERVERVEVDLAARQRAQLGGERRARRRRRGSRAA